MNLSEVHSAEPHSHSHSQPRTTSASLTSQLVPDLYSALAAALLVADTAIVEKDPAGKARGLEAATAVVFELVASVDFERGGELAPRLAALYSYFSSELLYIGRSDDRQQIRGLLDMIGVLTGTWHDGGVKMRY
jgi:flagellar protein FliS